MKRMLAVFLVVLTLVGVLALPVCAEAATEATETVVVAPEGVEMETVKVYGDEVPADVVMETVKVYGEQEQSFWGWLQNLWQQFISLFGF